MNQLSIAEHEAAQAADQKTAFGFWIYIMTDCVLFATLFATYAVLHKNTAGGPSGHELFSLPFALTETLILLVSSFLCGLALLAARRHDQRQTIIWFGLTFLLGVAFLSLELTEFKHLAAEGSNWQQSAFLSSFFTLVGTHGLHIASGLLWMVAMMAQVSRRGLNRHVVRRLGLLSVFWHFLDLVWIFIFTIVYLAGGVS